MPCAPTEGPFDSANLLPHRETCRHFFYFSLLAPSNKDIYCSGILNMTKPIELSSENSLKAGMISAGLPSRGLASKLNVILRCCLLFVFTLTNQRAVIDMEAAAPVLVGSYKYLHERGVIKCFILIAF